MALARIYRPSKSAMQSGRGQARKWLLEYEPASRRDPDPLMGWSSAQDTLNEVRLRFDSEAEAIAFARKHRLDYTLTISATTGCAPDAKPVRRLANEPAGAISSGFEDAHPRNTSRCERCSGPSDRIIMAR